MSLDKNISNISKDTGKANALISDKEEIHSRKYPLKEKNIGISISESDDLFELGYDVVHLKDAIIEIARYIIASGGKLVYGGDMRLGGFTELLFDLLAYYKADKEFEPAERFYSYLAYPISTTLTSEKEAELKQHVTFIKIDPPDDIQINNPENLLKSTSPDNLYVWTRCLTEMRKKMETHCNARIFLGGRTKNYKGKCPGILEEFFIAIEYKHPVYLVGAFGGISKDITNILNNNHPKSFSNDYHLKNEDYKAMFELYNKKHSDQVINFEQYYSSIKQIGFEGISSLNGLTIDENMRLANTPHISEIVFLILRGLTNCFTN